MLDRLSVNNLSSQLRTANTEGIPNYNQKENDTAVSPEIKDQADSPVKKEKVEEVVDSLNQFLEPTHTSLKFKLHEKLNEYYVSVIDDKTQETIREIPSKKLLDFYAAMTDFVGIMVDKKI
ncbi:flagellar protein FlaG [Bacillus sp. MUM 13]|uniref:flagellar protein FlaG n=1 Tax=Bacillus sp. MUM 13 TaxID=1678001 RepID=UPI0008F5A001|nr:flagellar protein FlaG [Bacillus sp. MUM 13]OIK11424.1 flagellar biosynthesis protein FlaG [Bacillus sp. MUM 13]